ncbi:MAG: MATE family efflux transporter [Spirochaetales bacterium]|nr:MATE family efflux transporter [Candidatus Physcosoma equi]
MDKLEKKENLKALLVLALPIVLEEILTTLLQYVDTAMVGRLGAEATASVSLTTTVNWLTGSLFSSIGVAVVAITSAAYGAKDEEKIRRVSGQTISYILASGLVIGALTVGLSGFIPKWMGAEKSIRKAASQYFFIISLPQVFKAATIIGANSLRAVKDSKTPMKVNLASNLLNIVLNYLLIYTFGLGVLGAAIATALSITLGGIIMLLAFLRNPILRFRKEDMTLNRPLLKETVKIGLPVMATATTSCLGHIVFAGLVSSMGTIVFAAHSIALSAETIFYVPGYALRGATSTLIGISVGEDNKEKFKVVRNQSVTITVLMMVFSGLLLFLFARPIMGIFSPDEDVIKMGAEVLKLIAVSEPLFGLMIVSEGVYYGLGDTRYTFIIETIGAWGIRILSTLVVVHFFHSNLLGVWKCMFVDNAFRALALAFPLLLGLDSKLFSKRQLEVKGKVD